MTSLPNISSGRRVVGAALMVVAVLFGCGRKSADDQASPEREFSVAAVAAGSALTGMTAQTISLPFPAGTSRDAVVVGANGSLKLNDRVTTKNADGSAAAVSNAGATLTDTGVSAVSGSITSVASVNLRQSQISGNVTTAGVVTMQAGTTVSGTVTQHATLTPLNVFSWTVFVPQDTAGDVILGPDAVQTLSPGSYANVTVNSRAKLTLVPGTYYLTTLDVESGGQLILDKSSGPVIVYVRGTIIYRGSIVTAAGPEGDFLLVALGSTAFSIEQPFVGTIVAPNAGVTLASAAAGYRGTFYAHDIEIHQGSPVVAIPFSWTRLIPPPPVLTQPSPDPVNPPRLPAGPFGTLLTPTSAARVLPRVPYLGRRAPFLGIGPTLSGSGAPRPEPQGTTSFGGGADNIGWGYTHEAMDYVTPAGALADGEPGVLPLLSLRRYYKPGFSPIVSSFGLGMFSNYDSKLRVVSNGSGGFNILSFQMSNDLGEVVWTETDTDSGDSRIDGVFHTTAGIGPSIQLLTSSNALTPDPTAAASAVLTEQNGNQTVFELVNTGTDVRSGRLSKERDPNGNAVTVAYVFAANATLTQLGNDRTNLWKMASVTDPHGVAGTFDYASGKVNGRWAVSAFHAPNATTITYAYNPGQVLGGTVGPALSQASFPDGTTATFSTAVEASTNLAVVHINDRAAAPGFMVKDVYLSQSQMKTASGTLVAQQPNLLRQIINGAGEVAYANWDDSARPGTTYVYEGGGTLLRLDLNGNSTPTAFARASFFDPTHAPSQATFEPVETYQNDDLGRLTSKTDTFGRSTVWERDRLTLAVKGLQFPDGSRQTRTFGPFLRLTSLVDRNGNTNQFAYDVLGNVLSAIKAVGQAIASKTSTVLNTRGQTTQTTDGRGNVTDYTYDTHGFLVTSRQPPDVTGAARATRSYEYDSAGRMTAAVDPEGRRETYAYDARNRLTKTTFPDGTTQVVTYGTGSTAGLIVKTTDRKGNVSTMSYDGATRLTTRQEGVGTPAAVADSKTYLAGTTHVLTQTKRGERTDFAFDSKGRVVGTTLHPVAGRSLTSSSRYDSLGRMTLQTDAYGRRTFFFFDGNDRLLRLVRELVVGGVVGDPGSLTRQPGSNPSYAIEDHFFGTTGEETLTVDAAGTATRNDYDSLRRVVQRTEGAGTPLAALTQFSYDAVGNLTKLISPRHFSEGANTVSQYTYNGRNLVASVTKGPGSAAQAVTRITYTLSRRKATVTDTRGGVTRYRYSACCNQLTSITEPNGAVTTFTSDALGNRLSTTDANGNSRTTTYDALNRPIAVTNGAGETTSYAYDDNLTDGAGIDQQLNLAGLGFGGGADGSAVAVTNPLGATRFMVQDGLGRPVLEQDETGMVVRHGFDSIVNGLVESTTTDALGHTTRDRADANEGTRAVVDAEGNMVVKGFDAVGRLMLTADPTSRGSSCTLDALGRTTSCTDTAGDQASAGYDAEGNGVSSVDGLGAITRTAFDELNRPTTKTDRLGNQQLTAYDAASNVVSTTDAENGVTTFSYDARNLRTQEHFADGGTITQEYDTAGRLVAKTTPDGVRVVNSYDAADRLISRTFPDGKVDTYTYDRASRLIRAVSGRYNNVVDRTYDAAGRLLADSLTVGGVTRTVTSGYDAAGRRATVDYPDGSRVSRTFTARNLISAVSSGSQAIASYAYDAAGRVLTNTMGNGKVESYAYRGDGLASGVTISGVSALTYAYNANKRETQESRDGQPFDAFGYDAEERVTSFTRRGTTTQTWTLTPEGDWSQVFFNGSETQSRDSDVVHQIEDINEHTFSYDARGQMTNDPVNGRSFTWGQDGRLTHASALVGEGTESADYAYDALGRKVTRTADGVTTTFVSDGNEVVAEYDGSALARTYVLGSSVDQPLAMKVGTATYFFARQQNDSIHAAMDVAGNVVERYEYDAYGVRTIKAPDGTIRPGSTIGNPYGFTGRYHDSAIGLIDFRARYFSPELGVFLSRDDSYADGPNLYRGYFAPDRRDPTGHFGLSDLNPVNLAGDLAKGAEDLGKDAVGAAKDVVNGVSDAGNAVVGAAVTGATSLYDASKTVVNAAGDAVVGAANDLGHAVTDAVNAVGDATNAVVGAARWAGTELATGVEYLGNQIWLGAQFLGTEAWKGTVAFAKGAWRLGGEFVEDAWQSTKALALAYWDLVVTDLVCAWDIVKFYELLFTGHPLDALKKLTAGVGNLAISAFEAGLVFGSIAGGWANPLGGFTTAFGLTVGLIGWALGGDAPEIHWHNGGFVFEFGHSPFARGVFGDYSRTLGRAILFNGDPADERGHEWQHVTQYGLLGETYIPVQLLSQGVSVIINSAKGGSVKDTFAYSKYNLLEVGPYMPNHQPWPNIPRIPW